MVLSLFCSKSAILSQPTNFTGVTRVTFGFCLTFSRLLVKRSDVLPITLNQVCHVDSSQSSQVRLA